MILNEKEEKEISVAVNKVFSIKPSPGQDLRTMISLEINRLIVRDFNLLITTLYLLDISEKKLTAVLASNPGEDAGILIAELVIERELEKFRSRQLYRNDKPIADEDRW
ncbi:MAG: hypothetical protein EOO01_42940 [Chitinophagaceae bacterium]|nr:MAG: hypothetical protein EOO01_42940 [Chitinophagaceae bacterium]